MAPIAGFAAIDGTHHDMTVYMGAGTTDEKCAFCHSVSLTDIADAGVGQVGTFCAVVCHDATRPGLTNAIVAGPGMISPTFTTTAAVAVGLANLTGGHGLEPAVGMPAIDQAADVTATDWPHSKEAQMQCTTCHAVHDGTNPPFLNGPFATGDNTTANTGAFCNRCHDGANGIAAGKAGRWANIADMGAHPTEFVYSAAGAAGPTANAGKGGRVLSFKAPLVNTTAAVTTTVAAFNATITGNAWRQGGHLIDTATKLPVAAASATATTRFGCYSCHSAHQADEGGVNLIVGSVNQARAAGASSTFCVACHGATQAANTDPVWNVGDTNYGHPANETADLPYQHDHELNVGTGLYGHGNVHPNIPSTGSFPIDVALPAALSGLSATDDLTAGDFGANGEILCNTCHKVHNGVANQMAIRNINGIAAGDNICVKCHGTLPQPTGGAGINRHHPTPASADIDPVYSTAALTWADAGGNQTMGDGLGCADCHVFGDTAHNW
jgi:predicted CXXCH cytochrome family protein